MNDEKQSGTKRNKRSLRIELIEEDYELLEKKRKKRGVDKSTYIRELIRDNHTSSALSEEVKQALDDISSAGMELRYRDNITDDEKRAIEQLEKGVRTLWRCLR